MTMQKALYPRDDIERSYVSRKEGGRGLAGIEDSENRSRQRIEDNTEKRGGRLITATRNNTNNTRTSRTTIVRKQRWELKQLYERFKRQTVDILHQKTLMWLRKGNLKRETESFRIAAQSNTIRTNHIKARKDKTQKKKKNADVGHVVKEPKGSIT